MTPEQPVAIPEDAKGLSRNPLASASTVLVSIPETVEVKLVDASALSEYEVWSLVTSVLCSALIGFIVAYMQAAQDKAAPYGWISVVLALLVAITATTAVFRRQRLTSNIRRVRFRLGDPVESETPPK